MDFDEKRFLKIARQLIAVRSSADNSQGLHEAIKIVLRMLQDYPSIHVEQFVHNGKPSLLAYVGERRPEKFKVLLNGHVDVVPGKPSLFTLRKDNDILSGRGTLDMKLTVLAMVDAFTAVAPYADYAIGLQIVSDEEAGGYDGTLHQKTMGITADFTLVGEYTGLDICTESKGFCRLSLTAKGVMAHSANLWNGQNAIVRLQQALARLLEIYPVPTEETWATTINLATFHTTNTVINAVPEDATAELDVRFVKDDPNFANQQAIRALLASIDPSLTVSFLAGPEPPIAMDLQNPYLSILRDTITATTGKAPGYIRKHGSADARFYSPHAVVFGPAGKGLHADDELVSLSSICEYRSCLEQFLLNAKG